MTRPPDTTQTTLPYARMVPPLRSQIQSTIDTGSSAQLQDLQSKHLPIVLRTARKKDAFDLSHGLPLACRNRDWDWFTALDGMGYRFAPREIMHGLRASLRADDPGSLPFFVARAEEATIASARGFGANAFSLAIESCGPACAPAFAPVLVRIFEATDLSWLEDYLVYCNLPGPRLKSLCVALVAGARFERIKRPEGLPKAMHRVLDIGLSGHGKLRLIQARKTLVTILKTPDDGSFFGECPQVLREEASRQTSESNTVKHPQMKKRAA